MCSLIVVSSYKYAPTTTLNFFGVYIMSIISNIHTVTSYTSGKTKPLDGQRLAKVTYKVDKATGIKPDSKAVSIPVIGWGDIEPHLNALKGEFIAVVHKVQDGIVRGKVEAGAVSINGEDISMSAVVAYLLEDSGRLTGDIIRGWFFDTLREPLILAFASKLGIAEDAAPTADQEVKLEKIIKGYEDSFAKLASGAATFSELQKTSMIKALQFAEEDDSIAAKFTARLSASKNEDDLLMA